MRTRVEPETAIEGHAQPSPDDSTLQGAYERYHDRVFDLCYHFLGQVADAEDVVQETFARAARRLPTLTGDRGAYLLAVARNLCCNELRRRKRVVAVEAIDREDHGVEAERGIVERAMLERLWVRLSPRERSLIHDTFAGFSQQEIAGRIGLSPNAVAVALLRARQRARTYAGRALAAFFPLAAAWRLTQRGARRVATMPAEAASAVALQIQQVGMVLTAAIVGAMAVAPAVAGAPTAATVHPGTAGAVASRADGAAQVDAGTPSSPGTAENAAGRAASGGQGAATGSPLTALVAPGRDAPPEQVYFTSFTPSPHYAGDHTVFASGYFANGCQVATSCSVLYRSDDAGRTWHNVDASGFAGGRLLLPPAWPADKIMFVMSPSGLLRSDDGRHFQPVLPVSAPAAIAPDSTPGNARVLIAANPMLVYSAAGKGTVSQGPVLPPGLSAPDDVAYLGDSQHVLVSAEEVSTTGLSAGQQTGAIVRCVGAVCSVVRSTPGVWEYALAVSPTFTADHAVVAVSHATVLRSVDGGADFTMGSVPIPATAAPLVAAVGGASSGAVLAGYGGRQVVVGVPAAGNATTIPTDGLPTGAPLGALLALPDGRLLAARPSVGTEFGVLCLAAGGSSWSAC